MPRATSIGGVFFKVKDTAATRTWYREHLGLNTDDHGTAFEWRQAKDNTAKGFTQWSPFRSDSDYFDAPFMINYRVDDLPGLLDELREKGVRIVSEIEEYDYGSFAHIIDGDGHRVELWEPRDDVYAEMAKDGSTC